MIDSNKLGNGELVVHIPRRGKEPFGGLEDELYDIKVGRFFGLNKKGDKAFMSFDNTPKNTNKECTKVDPNDLYELTNAEYFKSHDLD